MRNYNRRVRGWSKENETASGPFNPRNLCARDQVKIIYAKPVWYGLVWVRFQLQRQHRFDHAVVKQHWWVLLTLWSLGQKSTQKQSLAKRNRQNWWKLLLSDACLLTKRREGIKMPKNRISQFLLYFKQTESRSLFSGVSNTAIYGIIYALM